MASTAYDRPVLIAAAALLERARTEFDAEQGRRMAETRQRVRDGATRRSADSAES